MEPIETILLAALKEIKSAVEADGRRRGHNDKPTREEAVLAMAIIRARDAIDLAEPTE